MANNKILTTRMFMLMLRESQGDVALLSGLVALRYTERGGPGREMGILSVSADTLEEQIHVAANTFRNNVKRYQKARQQPAYNDFYLYSEDFLRFFSERYAPLGADNDPKGLNKNHAKNLIFFYAKVASTPPRLEDA